MNHMLARLWQFDPFHLIRLIILMGNNSISNTTSSEFWSRHNQFKERMFWPKLTCPPRKNDITCLFLPSFLFFFKFRILYFLRVIICFIDKSPWTLFNVFWSNSKSLAEESSVQLSELKTAVFITAELIILSWCPGKMNLLLGFCDSGSSTV